MLTGSFPFKGNLSFSDSQGIDERDLFNKIQNGSVDYPASISRESKNLIQNMLKVNP